MESSHLVSWQFENFSTAELSPPSSPISPSSPTLFYDGSNPSSPKGINTMAPQQSHKSVLSSVVTSRAQTASNMLNELERLHYFDHQTEFGMNNNEEAVDLNMNLFEELADIEYTPPLASLPEESESSIGMKSSVVSVNAPQPQLVSIPQTNEEKLSAEYKAIIESLSSANTITTTSVATTSTPTAFGNFIQIAGIPTTTVVDNECLVPVEFIGHSNSIGAEEVESMDLDGIIISNEMEFVNENQLFSLEELSAELIADESNAGTNLGSAVYVDGVLPTWAKDMTIPLDELDSEMHKNSSTLDALLKGDVSAAKEAISSVYATEAFSPISNGSAVDEDEDIEDSIVEEVIVVETKPKAERRGRKPGKANKNSLTYIKDKALRKKEQNKTAATRYRLKKKQELAVTLVEEDDLQQVHDELEKQKEKIVSEVRMVRSLLREMLQARKNRATPSISLSAGRLTASSLVQAQKVANRRK